MKKYFHIRATIIGVMVCLLFATSLFAQTPKPSGNPTQKVPYGWMEWGYIHADSANIFAKRNDTMWHPRFPGTVQYWRNLIGDTSRVWLWDSVSWKGIDFTIKKARQSVNNGLFWNWNPVNGMGAVDTAGLFGVLRDTIDSRFGLNITNPSVRKYLFNPRVVGVRSVAELRSLVINNATDTQFVVVLTNYTLNYVQEYQYDPNDASSTDNGATIIVAGTKRFRAIFPSGMVNVKIFGATGNNSTDDHDAIQAACDALVADSRLPRNLYFPQGVYRISKPIIIYKWDGVNYQQCNVNLIGQEFQHWNDLTSVARIKLLDTASFAIGVQQGRSMVIKGLSIEGPFVPPFSGYIDYYKRPFATWASAYGVRDQRYSPLAGINIDPFGNQTGVYPADGGYTNYSTWYRGTGTNAGSSGVHVEQCRITGFTVGIALSLSSLVQNGENMVFRDLAITQCKVAYASGQLQTKANFIYNGISDDRVFAIVSGDYGNGHGQQPYIVGYNIAGTVISVCHGMSNQFPISFQNIFAEGLYQIGDGQTGAGSMEFINCNLDFALYTTPYPIPPYHWKGDNVKFEGCTMRYYDDSLNRRLFFSGLNISFKNCWFDKPPIGKYDNSISSSLPVFSFDECRTGNFELIGWKTIKGRINSPGYQIVKYGHVEVEDAGQLTTDDVGLRSLKMKFDFGSLNRFAGIGTMSITIDTINRIANFSISAGASTVLAAGDYIIYSADSVLGRIKSVNYSTGAISVVDVPVGIKTGTFTNPVAEYYSIARGALIGKVTNGSPTIDSVKFANLLGSPVVGDRADIGFPETIITAVGGSSITLSANAYYTHSQEYRPLDRSEKIEVTSYYDPSHANLDGWNFIMPQNATWKIWTSPYTNVQHTYKFYKGGYMHMSTVSGPPTYWQAAWQLTADDNPDKLYITEPGTINIPTGPMVFNGGSSTGTIQFGTNNSELISVSSGAMNFATGNGVPKVTITNAGDIQLAKHIIMTRSITSITGGTGEGTGGSRTCTCGDIGGKVDVTTGTGPATSATVETIVFSNAYTVAPFVILTPGNANAAALSGTGQVYISSISTTQFVITVGSTALGATTQYIWYYQIVQ